METETIDKLFLELSQFSRARTAAMIAGDAKNADFVRRVREMADEIIGGSEIGSRAERLADKIISLCDAEEEL